MTYVFSTHIDAPVARVFELFSDPGRWNEAGRLAATIHDVSLSPSGVGTTYRWTARFGPVRLEGRNEFTAFVPNELITDESSRSFEGTWTYRFATEDGGTRVTIQNSQRSFWRVQPLGKLMDFMASGHRPIFEQLKAALEKDVEGSPSRS